MGLQKFLVGAVAWVAIVLGVMSADGQVEAQPFLGSKLHFNFYANSCPQFDKIVEDTVAYYSAQDPTTPGPLLRHFFHDCFVQGCDASVLMNSTTKSLAEKDANINFSLGNFYVIDAIKAQLEVQCPGTVSCADVLALTAVYSIKQAGGPLYKIEVGRRDSLTSYAETSDVLLPAFSLNRSAILESFLNVGLNAADVVTLSGAHTIGQGHCNSIINRISPAVDPVYPKAYGEQLFANCTDDGAIKLPNFDNNTQFFNDPITPLIFDNQYYKNLEVGLGLFTSDATLFQDPASVGLVKQYAADQSFFFQEFGKALRKMGKIGVLTGTQGQIRKQCWVRNSNNLDPAFDPISFDFIDS